MTAPSIGQRILAIDYGTARIGIALSDPLRLIAKALETYPNNRDFLPRLVKILAENQVALVVVGMPLNLKGEEEKKAREVRAFIAELEKGIDIPVTTWDERFTTTMAKNSMIAMGLNKKKRREKARVDQIAAALLLQSFLDARAYENAGRV